MAWSRFLKRRFWDEERAQEIQSYIEIETDENIARGMSSEQAKSAAHKKFGNGTYIREEIYRMNTIGFIESLWKDMRYAFRSLCRNPGFAATAIITLAIGIGANTAVFNVVDAMIFRPLPYQDSGQLVSIAWESRDTLDRSLNIHYLSDEIDDWRAQKPIFTSVEPYYPLRSNNPNQEKADSFYTIPISTGMLKMLGIQPKLGRGFLPEEGQPGRDQIALLSNGYWVREFGADPSVLGKTFTRDNRVYSIVGIMPGNFEFPVGEKPDAWVPWTKEPNGMVFSIVARLRPGLHIDQAQREALLVSGRIHIAPFYKKGRLPYLSNLKRNLDPKTRTALLAMFCAVGFVFIIACANVANMMLSRGATRQREVAIRAAIGGSRARLIRHFLVESFILSTAGGIAAFLLASWMTRLIIAKLPLGMNSKFLNYSFAQNGRLFVFMGIITVLACLLSGLIPAFRAARGNRIRGLMETSHLSGAPPALQHVQSLFQSLQVGLALVLLIGAGLMANSFMRLTLTKPGFDTANLWFLEVKVPSRPKRVVALSLYNQLKMLIKSIPGVKAATISRGSPVARRGDFSPRIPEGETGAGATVSQFFVAQDYFSTLGIPIVGGRNFGPEDDVSSAPIAIIDSRCADNFWPGQSPLGKQLRTEVNSLPLTIIGIVAPVKTMIFAEPNNCQLYELFSRPPSAVSLVIRIAGNPGPVLAQVRLMAATLNPKIEISDIASFDNLYAIRDTGVADAPRFYLILMLIFATVALATTAVGIYGLLSYSVARRTPEIGVRIALGATARDIRMLLIRAILTPVSAGIMLGILASFWLTRLLRTLLYEITPHDPVTMILVIAFLLLVSLAACLFPCRRATRVDPMTALRVE
jgi:predicted permease